MEVKRGEIWLANLSPTKGSEQAGTRPVLIVQTDRANPYSPNTIIVPFTTTIRQSLLPSHVLVSSAEENVKEDSVLLCEQIRVVSKSRFVRLLGLLSDNAMSDVEQALKVILELKS